MLPKHADRRRGAGFHRAVRAPQPRPGLFGATDAQPVLPRPFGYESRPNPYVLYILNRL
jgi:hypothetical protein